MGLCTSSASLDDRLGGPRAINSCGYRLNPSKKQLELIRETQATLDREAVEPSRIDFGEAEGSK